MKYDSLVAMLEAFPNEESCIEHLEQLRWPKGKELFTRMLVILHHGAYVMANKYKGTGAPGTFLEDLLGLTTFNRPLNQIHRQRQYRRLLTSLHI